MIFSSLRSLIMKWPVLILTLCTLIICFSIASESASAQTYGGYGTGFWQSPPTPYYGYYNSGYGGGSQYARWQRQRNGLTTVIVLSFNQPAYGGGYGRHRHNRNCNCR